MNYTVLYKGQRQPPVAVPPATYAQGYEAVQAYILQRIALRMRVAKVDASTVHFAKA
jgi:hypothetical protein